MKNQRSGRRFKFSLRAGEPIEPKRSRRTGHSRYRVGRLCLFLIGILAFPVVPAAGQALNDACALTDMAVRSKGAQQTVFMLPGDFEPEKWYYTTSQLHFGMREVAGEDAPEMTLLRYQRPDPDNPHKYVEGATLQLAVDIDPLDDSAKRSLLGKARTAADGWESSHYKAFSARLEEQAGKSSSDKQSWQALLDSYSSARRKDLTARNGKNVTAVLEQALGDGLEEWVIVGLEESARLLRMRNPASLTPLPMTSAQVCLYDGVGEAVLTTGPTRGAAPEYATENLGFTVELGKNATDVSEALLTSQTGILVILRREYEVLSAPLPYKFIIDYDEGSPIGIGRYVSDGIISIDRIEGRIGASIRKWDLDPDLVGMEVREEVPGAWKQ